MQGPMSLRRISICGQLRVCLTLVSTLWLLSLGSGLTLAMALLSGLSALRSLRLVEPITLLR